MILNYTQITKNLFYSTLLGIILITGKICYGQIADTSVVKVNIIAAETYAVISILHKRENGNSLTEYDWQKSFLSEGNKRLKKREAVFHSSFADEDFKSFILSGTLDSHIPALKKTLDQWKRADIWKAARR
ncbi:MAG: hypothetical protein WCA84_06260 [Ignavibacteriaceae bacterium]|jgi:hypothetical protein